MIQTDYIHNLLGAVCIKFIKRRNTINIEPMRTKRMMEWSIKFGWENEVIGLNVAMMPI